MESTDMHDEPDAVTLLEAMATTLSDSVVPALSGGVQHEARVVANLCRILAREFAEAGPDRDMYAALLGHDGQLADLAAELDHVIVSGKAPPETLAVLLADVTRRAEITKPGYTFTDGT